MLEEAKEDERQRAKKAKKEKKEKKEKKKKAKPPEKPKRPIFPSKSAVMPPAIPEVEVEEFTVSIRGTDIVPNL